MRIYIYILYKLVYRRPYFRTNQLNNNNNNNSNNKIERLPFSPLNSPGRRIYLPKTVRNCISAVNLGEFYIRDADDSRFRPGQQITRRLSLSLSFTLPPSSSLSTLINDPAVHLSPSNRPSSREGAVVYGVLSIGRPLQTVWGRNRDS